MIEFHFWFYVERQWNRFSCIIHISFDRNEVGIIRWAIRQYHDVCSISTYIMNVNWRGKLIFSFDTDCSKKWIQNWRIETRFLLGLYSGRVLVLLNTKLDTLIYINGLPKYFGGVRVFYSNKHRNHRISSLMYADFFRAKLCCSSIPLFTVVRWMRFRYNASRTPCY